MANLLFVICNLHSNARDHHRQAAVTTRSIRPLTDLIRQARQGVLRQRVDEVANSVGLTDNEMARVLNVSVRSLHGKPDNQALALAAGERLLLLEGLLKRALSIFNGRTDLVNRWLQRLASTQVILADWLQTPFSLAVGVPSLIIDVSCNLLLHPDHPAFNELEVTDQRRLPSDSRLRSEMECCANVEFTTLKPY